MTRLLCGIALVMACGGRPGAPARSAARPQLSGGSAAVAGDPTEPVEPRRDERTNDACARLAEHTVALAEAERPPEHKLTADERSRLATQLHERWVASCKTMTSDGYVCVFQARTLVELDACGG